MKTKLKSLISDFLVMSFLPEYTGLVEERKKLRDQDVIVGKKAELYFDQAGSYRPILDQLKNWCLGQPQSTLQSLTRNSVRHALTETTRFNVEDKFQIYQTLGKIFDDPEIIDYIVENPKESIEKLQDALTI